MITAAAHWRRGYGDGMICRRVGAAIAAMLWWACAGGARAQDPSTDYVDYDHNEFKWDVTQQGPILGVALRF